VVVLGHGNVALDCARILAKGASGLYETDVASHALPILAQQQQQQQHDGSSHQCISIIGRRGHVQGAFTIKELRELTKLQEEGYGVKFHVLSEELDLGLTPASKEELAGPSGRPKTRIDKLLRDNAQASSNKTTDTRQVVLRFLLNPIRFEPDPNDPSKLGGVVCERTALVGDAGHQRAIGTGQLETIPAHLALVSIGYKGTPLPGLEPYFDEQRGTVKNHHGKVIMVNDEGHDGGLGKLYVSGWLKRGPSGIIGTNIVDAKDTVATIVKDLEEQLPLQPRQDRRSKDCNVMQLLEQRGVQVVDWPAYERIDTAETNPTAKRSEKQPREKITTRLKLLEAART
jgi:adrenodoxin-NADP+ reductase